MIGFSGAGIGGAIVGSAIGALLGYMVKYGIFKLSMFVAAWGVIAIVLNSGIYLIGTLWGVGN